MQKYKDETYRGMKVTFMVRRGAHHNHRIAARVPQITTQFLGLARTKAIAFDEAKNEIDRYLSKHGEMLDDSWE